MSIKFSEITWISGTNVKALSPNYTTDRSSTVKSLKIAFSSSDVTVEHSRDKMMRDLVHSVS